MIHQSVLLFVIFILSLHSTDAAFDVTKVVPIAKLNAQKTTPLKCSNCRNKGTPTRNVLLILAVDKNPRKIMPKITWEGRSGGDGCSFIEKLFGTPGCETTKETGEADFEYPKVEQGPFARFLPYYVPSFTTVIRIETGVSGQCGKRGKTTSCSEVVTAFKSEGAIGATISPGCTKLLYQKKTSSTSCRRPFPWIGTKRCSTSCWWIPCENTDFGARIYGNFDNLNEFQRLQLQGEYISTCPTQTADKFFTL